MPMVKRGVEDFKKLRLLVSGLSYSGKTTSLPTFIHGGYDYWDDDQQSKAIEYANGKSMVIISVPGEPGYKALVKDTPYLTSYYSEEEVDFEKLYEFSLYAVDAVNSTYKEVVANKPDILFIDGGHVLYNHLFNTITKGEWLEGVDMAEITNARGVPITDKYRPARFHDTAQKVFINYLGMYYNSPVPLFGMTTWEDWKSGSSEAERAAGIEAERYLWPALAGAMATRMPGQFDARVSARIEKRCLHKNCQKSKDGMDHFVWQFYPRGDVKGIGIKGLKVTDDMMRCPYIHQSWPALRNLLGRV